MSNTERNSALKHNPLSDEDIQISTFYGRPAEEAPAAKLEPVPLPELELEEKPRTTRAKKAKKAKPDHYKIVCISLYREDIENLESMVRTLKERGHHKANKSQLIRYALSTVDLDSMPKSI
jgi:hypothetical protein